MIPFSPLRMPVTITWEVTGRCNLACEHCLSNGVQDSKEMGFEEAMAFLEDLHRANVFQINFGGGEPFLREDFLDILQCTTRKGIVACVSTNGTLLDESTLKRLKKISPLYLQVSLDGASPSTNDAIRGDGTFQRVMDSLRLLKAFGFSGVAINVVVLRDNVAELEQLYAMASEFGFALRCTRFRPFGKGRVSWDRYSLRAQELMRVRSFLAGHLDVRTGDSFFPITTGARKGLNMCGAARMTCSISPSGSVYPCPFLAEEPFKAGNVLTSGLWSIWKEAQSFELLRRLKKPACLSCAFFQDCHGGCPAVAYALYGSLEWPDPECVMNFAGERKGRPWEASSNICSRL